MNGSGLVVAFFLVMLSSTAFAVEPTHVNFGAKRESEDVMLKTLEAFFARRAASTAERSSADATEFASIFKGLKEAKLSASAASRLVEIYFQAEANHDISFIPSLDRLFTERAEAGQLPEAVLEAILKKTPDGRMTEIVTTAIVNNPALKTPALEKTIHQEFTRIIKQAQYAYEVHGSILQLADPEKVKVTPEVAAKLKLFVSGKDDLAYSRMIESNPRLLAAVASDLPVHSLHDMEAFIAMKLASMEPLGPGRSTDVPAAAREFATHGAREIRQAMVDVSRDRIRSLMNQNVNKVSADLSEKELVNALDLMSDIDRTPYLADLQKLVTTPGHGDRVRQEAMFALGKSARAHPEVRVSIFQAAGMLERTRSEILDMLSFLTKQSPLSFEEITALRTVLARADLPNDGAAQAALIQLRRGTMRAVAPSCATAFGGLLKP